MGLISPLPEHLGAKTKHIADILQLVFPYMGLDLSLKNTTAMAVGAGRGVARAGMDTAAETGTGGVVRAGTGAWVDGDGRGERRGSPAVAAQGREPPRVVRLVRERARAAPGRRGPAREQARAQRAQAMERTPRRCAPGPL